MSSSFPRVRMSRNELSHLQERSFQKTHLRPERNETISQPSVKSKVDLLLRAQLKIFRGIHDTQPLIVCFSSENTQSANKSGKEWWILMHTRQYSQPASTLIRAFLFIAKCSCRILKEMKNCGIWVSGAHLVCSYALPCVSDSHLLHFSALRGGTTGTKYRGVKVGVYYCRFVTPSSSNILINAVGERKVLRSSTSLLEM